MSEIIAKIEEQGMVTMSDILNDLIEDHKIRHDRMLANYKRYQASKDPDGVPIFRRRFENHVKINNKLNNTFDSDIIDVKVGYMLGNPIIYDISDDLYLTETEGETVVDKEAKEKDMQVIEDFNKLNNIEDLDAETLKMASVCAYGARLLYIDKDGERRVMDVNPWECIFVDDGSLNEPAYAMRYYEIESKDDIQIYVEWYDDVNVYYFLSEKQNKKVKAEKLKFEPYSKDGKTVQPHMFDGIPLIKFPNNKEDLGDCDKVYALIDGYDNTLSDANSEVEQFRLAYLAFYGMSPDEKTMELARRTGAFGMTDPADRIEFITKKMDDAIIEHHLDRIEKNIYKFGKSVNFSDEDFAGNVSGVAMKFKMFGLESKCIVSERKFNASLRQMYKILSTAWSKLGNEIDYMDIDFIWTRNFPLNLLDESQTAVNLSGVISKKTLLGLLSFIDDPDKELEQIDKEMEEAIAKIPDFEDEDEGEEEEEE
jgi:SPP1 family phage portal protein